MRELSKGERTARTKTRSMKEHFRKVKVFNVASAVSLGKITRSSWGCKSGPITQVVFTAGERLLSVLLTTSQAFIEQWFPILAAHMNHLEELLENTNI